MAKIYFALKALNQEWSTINGTTAVKWGALQESIQDISSYVYASYFDLLLAERDWSSLGMNSLFPNDANELVFDNPTRSAQDPTRPGITGQDVQRLNARWREWIAWQQKNVFDPSSLNSVDYVTIDSFGKLKRSGSRAPTQGMGLTIATTLALLLIADYDASPDVNGVGAHLKHILTVAPYPLR